MAKMNGCNSDMVKGPVGEKETRMNPAAGNRGNLSKGGVNKHAGGSDKWDGKPALKAGANGSGKYRHDKK